MKTYLSYKNTIEGLENVLETIKAEEKIAASSIHFLKKTTQNLNVYTNELRIVLERLFLFQKNHLLFKNRNSGKKVLILITGNKGLVGGLWHNLINTFLQRKREYQIIAVFGKKGVKYLKEERITPHKVFSSVPDLKDKKAVKEDLKYIFDGFEKEKWQRVDILYSRFISLTQQQPLFTTFLPFEPPQTKNHYNEIKGLPIFEPSKRKIFDIILKKYIWMSFLKILAESQLSELSARVVTTEHSSTKTENLIKHLSLDYFKARRKDITKKQLESFSAHSLIKS